MPDCSDLAFRLRQMTAADIPAGLELCRAARWNQIDADWRRYLALNPAGARVAVDPDDHVIGSVTTLRYDGGFAWLAMVLVSPDHRRQGIASSLVEEAIDLLGARTPVRLDATPAGELVYRKLGFEPEYALARMERLPAEPARRDSVTEVVRSDRPAEPAGLAGSTGTARPDSPGESADRAASAEATRRDSVTEVVRSDGPAEPAGLAGSAGTARPDRPGEPADRAASSESGRRAASARAAGADRLAEVFGRVGSEGGLPPSLGASGLATADPATEHAAAFPLRDDAVRVVDDATRTEVTRRDTAAEVARGAGPEGGLRPPSFAASGPATAAPASEHAACLMDEDAVAEVLALDREVFGADRASLLRMLRDDAPGYAILLRSASGIEGYAFGRHGFTFDQLGPIVARDERVARGLVSHLVASHPGVAFLIDAPRQSNTWMAWLGEIGFREQRGFVRMVRGGSPSGCDARVFATIGADFG